MVNRIKSWAIVAATVLFAASSAVAQYKCGVSTAAGAKIMQQMNQNRQEMRDYIFERNAVTYIPVRFFLVAKSDGTGRTSERAGLQALCLLNQNYEDQNMQFYLKEFKYINSTSIYSDPMSFGSYNAISNQMVYNAINIFMVHEMSEEGVLAYYQPEAGPSGNDWIVCLENYAGQDLVITHEVGHFFSLNHTFYGWESSGGWNEADYGNPVGPYSPDNIPNEKVNMSNCTTAGDQICDTPADYMFPNNNCAYTLNAKDPNGQLLSPDIHNFMNYVYGCSEYHFTNQQKVEIQNSLFSNSRNYIRPNYTPNLAEVTETPTIVSPQQSEVIPTYNAVPLEWTAVPGADRYLVELTSSGQEVKRVISNTNSITVNGLIANKSYLWKVMAYNEYSTCGSFSGQKIFKTGDQLSDTSTIPNVSSWSIGPNPVHSGTSFFINMETTQPVEVSVTVHAMTGQTVKEVPGSTFQAGSSSLEVPTDGLSAGFYLVTLRTKSNFQTQRLSIVD